MTTTALHVPHPGVLLKKYYLDELGISQYRLAKETGMAAIRVSEILKGRRSITPNTALRLAKFFGTTYQYWMNLQNEYDARHIGDRDRETIDHRLITSGATIRLCPAGPCNALLLYLA
jgi:addiction module HigA family antidote